MSGLDDLTTMPLVWTHTGYGEIPYTTDVDGRRYTIRINDFPAEPMYTLLVDGGELMELEDWPAAWSMPGPPKELLALLKPRV